jgi:hypothetical protein
LGLDKDVLELLQLVGDRVVSLEHGDVREPGIGLESGQDVRVAVVLQIVESRSEIVSLIRIEEEKSEGVHETLRGEPSCTKGTRCRVGDVLQDEKDSQRR